MEIEYSDGFIVHFKARANRRTRLLYERRLRVFLKNPHDPSLRNHALDYDWAGVRSFSLTDDDGPDDYRVLFRRIGRKQYLFVDFGTHDQLYRPWRGDRDTEGA